MKKYFAFFIISSLLFLTSCEKDQNEPENPNQSETNLKAPEISSVEIGYENSKEVYIERDLHLEGVIVAEEGIKQISVQIAPQDDLYTYFIVNDVMKESVAGLKEYHLHKHYDVPYFTTSGMYDVVIVVIDQKNQKKVYESELKVIRDPSKITINNVFIEAVNGKVTVKANIRTTNKIQSIQIKTLSVDKTFTDADIVGKTAYSLNKVIEDPKVQLPFHFDVYIIVTDQKGEVNTFKRHIHQH